MNQIIQPFMEKGIKNLTGKVLKLIKDGNGLSEIVSEVKKGTDKLGRGICVEVIESLDDSIRNDPGRKRDWNVERRKEESTIITKLGAISYNRTYYKSKNGKSYRHLVDEILGVDAHTRIDDEIYAELAESASNLSYRKAGKNVGEVEISGQTAMKSVPGIEKLKLEKVPVDKKAAEIIYVEADEDHIALQLGKGAMPRLVYVHEGIDTEGRRKLKSPYYLASLKGKPGDLWQEVYEYRHLMLTMEK